MTEESRLRRKRLDHERYLRHQEERKKKQHEYYLAHREEILVKVHEKRMKDKPIYKNTILNPERERENRKAYQRAYYLNVTKPKRLALCHTI